MLRDAENTRQENAGPICRVGNAGLENGGNDIVWNTVYYVFLLSPAGCDHLVCLKGAAVAPVSVPEDRTANSDAGDDDEVRNHNDSDQPQSAVSEPQSQDLCEVCLVQQRDTRLASVPCGHQRFCASCVAQLEQLEFGMYPQSMPTEWTHARTLRRWQSVRLDL